MKKSLLLLLAFPFLSNAQETISPKKEIFSALQLATKINTSSPSRSTTEQLDSVIYQEFYDPDFFMAFKYEYVYNTAGQESNEYVWMYDFGDDTIVKTNFEYNGLDQLYSSTTISNFWGSWENNNKKYYYYDGNGYLATIIDSAYNSTSGLYYLDRTFTFTYNGSYNVTEVYVTTEPTVGQSSTTYYADQRLVLTYNVDETLSNITLQSFVDPNFEDRDIYDFTYTGLNSTGTSVQNYDSWNSQMNDNGDLIKYYDLTTLKSNLTLPVSLMYIDYSQKIGEDILGSYVNQLDSIYFNDASGDLNSITYYYYSENENNSLKNLEDIAIKMYPNPSTGLIYMSSNTIIKSIIVRDITGKIVFQNKSEISSKIDLSSLTNGMYQLSMYDESGRTLKTEKIILSK
jgi:hypothetical protein